MKNLIILVGPVGAGKTSLREKLKRFNPTIVTISGDEQGPKQHRNFFDIAINTGEETIVVDRMGFNREQRMRYIEPARKGGYYVTIIELKVPYDVCLERVMARKDHPTVESDNEELARKILDFYHRSYQKPEGDEWDEYYVIEPQFKS